MTVALIPIFFDIHNDCCCTAAVVATLRGRLQPPTRTNSERQKAKLHFFQFSAMQHPRFKKRIFSAYKTPKHFPSGPSVLDGFKKQL